MTGDPVELTKASISDDDVLGADSGSSLNLACLLVARKRALGGDSEVNIDCLGPSWGSEIQALREWLWVEVVSCGWLYNAVAWLFAEINAAFLKV